MSKNVLLHLARRVLNEVLSEINKQINRIQQEVIQEFETYLRQVVDGCWRGEDAEQFKSEVQGLLLPRLNEIAGSGGIVPRTQVGVENAAQVVERADQRVSGLVSNLNDTFSKIY